MSRASEIIGDDTIEFYGYNIWKAKKLVDRLVPVLASEITNTKPHAISQISPDVFRINSDSVITSDYLIEGMKSWVTLLRQIVFQADRVPFTEPNDAVKWLENEEAKLHDEEKECYHRDPVSAHGWPPYKTLHAKSLVYPTGRGSVWFMDRGGSGKRYHLEQWSEIVSGKSQVMDFQPLVWLQNAIERKSELTGFRMVSLVAFVMLGTKPILPRYRVSASHHVASSETGVTYNYASEATISVYARDVTFDELLEIYSKVRTSIGIANSKSLNSKHLAIYEMVQEYGDIPNKGVNRFWRNLQEKWNEAHPDDKYTSPDGRGLKKAYGTIMRKLEQRFPSKKPE